MIHFGTIGTGWITAQFIASSKAVPELSYTAAYSRSPEKASRFAAENGAGHTFTSLEEMASSPLIDAVYIASPNSLHYEQSLLFLKHKKHVICEKSVASSLEKVEKLLSAARENGVVFMEAIITIHMPQLSALKEAMSRIGRISMARFSYCQLSSKYPAYLRGELPNIFNPEFETGAAMDIGVYCVYPALLLFGECEHAEAHAVLSPRNIDLCGTAVLRYPGLTAELSYSKIADGRTPSEIQGDQGTILIDRLRFFDGMELIHTDGSREPIYTMPESTMPMAYEAQAFCDYITKPSQTKRRYEEYSRLAVSVSRTLADIRKASGVCF